MSIQSIFDKYATEYDSSRKKLIPCFDGFYQTAIDEIPFPEDQAIRVLDLGAGTGLMAGLVAAKYPKAKILLIDIAEKMLAEARKKLKSLENDFSFEVANYSDAKTFGKCFDLIISSLSIHHLSDDKKRNLFKSIYSDLQPGGVFINADQVLGDSDEIEKIYRKRWIEQVKANGVTEVELDAAFERMKEDKMSTLAAQIQWLKDAGFENANCWFKHYSFVVFSGRKEI